MATRQRGPRGGRTTVTPGGLIKATVFLGSDQVEALRKLAFDHHVSTSDLVRQAVDAFLESRSLKK